MSASSPARSHPGGPGLVEKGQIVSHPLDNLGGVGAIVTRALDVALAVEFVTERPPGVLPRAPLVRKPVV